jgi:hypothetical protein
MAVLAENGSVEYREGGAQSVRRHQGKQAKFPWVRSRFTEGTNSIYIYFRNGPSFSVTARFNLTFVSSLV